MDDRNDNKQIKFNLIKEGYAEYRRYLESIAQEIRNRISSMDTIKTPLEVNLSHIRIELEHMKAIGDSMNEYIIKDIQIC